MTYEEAMALTPDDELVITKIDFGANYRTNTGEYCQHTFVGQLAKICEQSPDIWASEYCLDKWDGCIHKIQIFVISPITGEKESLNWPISYLARLGAEKRPSKKPIKREW